MEQKPHKEASEDMVVPEPPAATTPPEDPDPERKPAARRPRSRDAAARGGVGFRAAAVIGLYRVNSAQGRIGDPCRQNLLLSCPAQIRCAPITWDAINYIG